MGGWGNRMPTCDKLVLHILLYGKFVLICLTLDTRRWRCIYIFTVKQNACFYFVCLKFTEVVFVCHVSPNNNSE